MRPPRGWTAREDPRACGDDIWVLHNAGEPAGRPPRVRGRPRLSRTCPPPNWKTPARAGTTLDGRARCRPNREDPRACGDDGQGQDHAGTGEGRPPRVRGRRFLSCGDVGARGRIRLVGMGHGVRSTKPNHHCGRFYGDRCGWLKCLAESRRAWWWRCCRASATGPLFCGRPDWVHVCPKR